MKKFMKYAALVCLAAFTATACQTEDIPEAGMARPQVINLTAVPGDEEVQLSWGVPDDCEPIDYIIFYTGDDSETVTLLTAGAKSYTVDGLTNDHQYDFNVQAVYGENVVSNVVGISGTPSTSRFPVTDLTVIASDGYVKLTWTKPSTTLENYTLTYYNEGNPDNVTTKELDKDLTSYELNGLTNDLNYYFSLVANYPKGASKEATVRAMPTTAIPYFVDTEYPVQNKPITFTFNRAEYATATDVKWTFPGNNVLEGDEVSRGLAAGAQTVVLSAKLGADEKRWSIELDVREFVVYNDTWEDGGIGFRGSSIVFSPDGKTVYAVTRGNCYLHAYDIATGERKWFCNPEINGENYNPIAVNPITGDIYYGSSTKSDFVAITPNGTLKWRAQLGTHCNQTGGPAVSADGQTVFAIDNGGNVAAFNTADGSTKWTYAAGKVGGGLLVNGNELVVGITSKTGTIQFLNVADGSVIDKLDLTVEMMGDTGFGVSLDKTIIYVPGKGANNSPGSGVMCSVDIKNHKVLVNGAAEHADNNFWCPVVGPEGNVVIPNKDGYIYCYDRDLNFKWKYEYKFPTTGATGANGLNFGRPSIDSEGRIYITGGQTGQGNVIIDKNGNQISAWSDTDTQGPMGGIGYLDGVLYSGGVAGLFIGQYVGGQLYNYEPGVDPANWKWMGCSGGDICNSWCLR